MNQYLIVRSQIWQLNSPLILINSPLLNIYTFFKFCCLGLQLSVSYRAMHHHKKSVYTNPVPCTGVSFGDATRFV
jgi:hypothetical protein